MTISEALTIILRYLVQTAVGWAIAKGLLAASAADDLTQALTVIVAAILTGLGMIAWALWQSRFKAKVESVLKVDGVSSVHASPEIVAQLKVPGVVPTPPAQP